MATGSGSTRRAQIVLEAVRAARRRQMILDAVNSFYIYRTDTNAVIARGVQGYEAAKDKANELRKRLDLKWDQVKFKAERNQSANSSAGSYGTYRASTLGGTPKGRMDYSKNYNPSKRGRFRGYYDKQGNYHDLD